MVYRRDIGAAAGLLPNFFRMKLVASVSKAERTAKRTRVPMQISVKKGVGGGPASIHEVAGILPQLAASGRNVTLVDGAKLSG